MTHYRVVRALDFEFLMAKTHTEHVAQTLDDFLLHADATPDALHRYLVSAVREHQPQWVAALLQRGAPMYSTESRCIFATLFLDYSHGIRELIVSETAACAAIAWMFLERGARIKCAWNRHLALYPVLMQLQTNRDNARHTAIVLYHALRATMGRMIPRELATQMARYVWAGRKRWNE